MSEPNVLRDPANTDAYRSAVATIIEDIERFEKLTLIEIADSIDASLGTISNAKNRKADLNATYLARLGQRFGGAYLNPYFAIFQTQAAPLDNSMTSDVLPLVMSLAHKIASARDPEGPGGTAEVPQEKRAYLPDLKRVNHRTGCLIHEIEVATA